MKSLTVIACVGACLVLASVACAESAPVSFEWFDYSGRDATYDQVLTGFRHRYRNPILGGYYPDPSVVRVVEMRYFAGMTEEQVAEALELSRRSVARDWEKAKLFLATALD